MALTQTEIDNAKPMSKAYKLVDGEGRCLLVTPIGSKLWRWRYYFAKTEKMMPLGEYPLVSLKIAREKHFEGRRRLSSGIDPMAELKATKKAKFEEERDRLREANSSFERIARNWWTYWSIGKSPRHADQVMRRLEADVFRPIGHKFIDDVIATDVRELILAIQERGARDVAKRAQETIGQIFRYAIANGLARRNPAADFRPSDVLKPN